MNISFDALFQRLVENRLGTDVVRPSDGQRVRYSDNVMIGEHIVVKDDDLVGTESFFLYPRHETKAGQKQLKATLDELFADCDNITIKEAGKPFTASPAR